MGQCVPKFSSAASVQDPHVLNYPFYQLTITKKLLKCPPGPGSGRDAVFQSERLHPPHGADSISQEESYSCYSEIKMASRREIRLVFHEQRFGCPHCRTVHIFHSTTLTFSGERTCLKCDKTFLIEDGIAKKLRRQKKPSL